MRDEDDYRRPATQRDDRRTAAGNLDRRWKLHAAEANHRFGIISRPAEQRRMYVGARPQVRLRAARHCELRGNVWHGAQLRQAGNGRG